MIRLSCRRFWRLSHLNRDRILTPKEIAFLELHRSRCSDCAAAESYGNVALDILAGSTVDHSPSPTFDLRTIRRWRLARARSSAAYWSPAVIGASVAALAVLAVLQVISHSAEMPTLKPRAEQGRNELASPVLPELNISRDTPVMR